MLALFFALGRFLAAFCVLAAFVLVSGRFFASWSAPRSILERSRTLRGGFWRLQWRIFPSFFMLSHARALAVRKSSSCAKTTVFPRFFPGFKQIAHVARKTKNSTISLLKPVDQSSPQKPCSKPVLERARLYLGGVRGSFGRLLDVSWPAYGCSWAAFGPSWALLGHLLGAFGRHLAHLSRLLGAF